MIFVADALIVMTKQIGKGAYSKEEAHKSRLITLHMKDQEAESH